MKDQANTLTSPVTMNVSGLTSLWITFSDWTQQMDYYRLVFLVGMILFQGCVTAPLFLWTMDMSASMGLFQMSVVTSSSFLILVSLLSVQPMRRTIPIFMIATLVQWLVSAFNVLNLF